MLILLSPAKTQVFDEADPKAVPPVTLPDFRARSGELIALLRKKTPAQLESLMGISPKLAALNADRYRAFSTQFTEANSRACILAFQGDVYDGLEAARFTAKQFAWAQEHLRILSGLYGVLRPLDRVQPYRLEMSIRLANKKGRDLYAYWGDALAEAINDAAQAAGTDTVINLASEEYSKAVTRKALKVNFISPQFKEAKGNQLRILALFAKRARGMMARHLIETQGKTPKALQSFTHGGYRYDADLSTPEIPVFTRPQPAAKAA